MYQVWSNKVHNYGGYSVQVENLDRRKDAQMGGQTVNTKDVVQVSYSNKTLFK